MEKLKTLKDFDVEKYQGRYSFKGNSLKEDIRQEAIKRAKFRLWEESVKKSVNWKKEFLEFNNINIEELK